MMDDPTYTAAPFVPFLLLAIAFAIGNGYLAPRLNRNAVLWVILSLIPLVNWFFAVYVAYTVVFYVIDRLKEATKGSVPAT